MRDEKKNLGKKIAKAQLGYLLFGLILICQMNTANAALQCGGLGNLLCPADMICVDDSKDNCEPGQCGADCLGICIISPPVCGGKYPLVCPNGMVCIDDPNNSCSMNNIFASCPGICVMSWFNLFSTRIVYQTFTSPHQLDAADLNKDGYPDIVVANENMNYSHYAISIYWNNGDGTFSREDKDIPAGSGTIAIGDYDHNNWLDIAESGDNHVSIFYGSENGFQREDYSVGGCLHSMIAVDLNCDGYLDLSIADPCINVVHTLIYDSSINKFNEIPDEPVLNRPVTINSGDFDEDGDNDLVTANAWSDDVTILQNNICTTGKTKACNCGTIPAFPSKSTFSVGDAPYPVITGDFNKDGHLDLATANVESNDISVLIGNGNGTFMEKINYGPANQPKALSTADFNGDGTLDLVAGNNLGNTISVFLNNPGTPGIFKEGALYQAGNGIHGSVALDFNGDSYIDFATVQMADVNVSVIFGNGDGSFRTAPYYPVGKYPVATAKGDFNMDNVLDLAIANEYSNDIYIFLGNNNGTFRKGKENYNSGIGPKSIASADVNGDNKIDLVTANCNDPASHYTIGVFMGKGDGTFPKSEFYITGPGFCYLAAADFNGDSYDDVAVVSSTSNEVHILLSNGDGSFKEPIEYSVDGGPVYIISAKFNEDTIPDLAIVNNANKTVAILIGAGDGTFIQLPAYQFQVAGSPVGITACDVNSDGKMDLATANYGPVLGTGSMSVLFGNGDGTFMEAQNYNTLNRLTSIACGDLNGDTKPDIVATQKYFSNASLFLNKGDGTFEETIGFLGVGGEATFVKEGDYNSDGRIDLAITNGYEYEWDTGSFWWSGVTILLQNYPASFTTKEKIRPLLVKPQKKESKSLYHQN